MKRLHLFLLTASLIGGAFAAAPSVSAATCSQLSGGGCVSIGVCQQFQTQNPAIQCLNADDCQAADSMACWVNTAQQPGDNCVGAGGSCKATCGSGEDSIGASDCPSGICCRTRTQAPIAAPTQAGPDAPTRIILPACISTGNCTLDDIVRTGVAFATFLLGLSAALFFLTFIYGGAMYLLSFGRSNMVERGKSALKGAAIGFILVMSAWAIVRFVDEALRGAAPTEAPSGTKPTCDQIADQGYSCKTLQGATTQEALQDAATKNLECRTGLCIKDPVNVLCCKSK